MNPFETDRAARLYAAGRPDYSEAIVDIIRKLAHIDEPLQSAADVGCGTGISTAAIAQLAESVVGVEPSTAMLEQARPLPNVSYRMGTAEDIPVPDSSCDLIAVGSALHWFDRDRFEGEADRIAKTDAVLVVFDHWFTGTMKQRDGFSEWVREVYLAEYPSPPRNRSWRPPGDLGKWRHQGWERYEHSVVFTPDGLASYLLTQSNLQVVMDGGDRTESELRNWIVEETTPFFESATSAEFLFAGFVACHRR